MRNKIISTFFVLLLLLTASTARAGLPIEAPPVIALATTMNIQKAAKIIAYMQEIDNTLNTIDSYGMADINAAMEQLEQYKGMLMEFQDQLRIGNIQTALMQAALGDSIISQGIGLGQLGDLKGQLNDLNGQLNNALNGQLNQLTGALEGAVGGQVNQLTGALEGAVGGQLNNMTGSVMDQVNKAAGSALSEVAQDGVNKLKDAAGNVVSDNVNKLKDAAGNVVSDNVNKLKDAAGNVVSDNVNKLKDAAGNVVSDNVNKLKDAAGNVVSDNVNKLKDAAGNVVADNVNKLKDAAGNVISDNVNKLADAMTNATMEQDTAQNGNPPVDYGKPQESIEKAQQYVKDTFFYSIREGDKYDGELIPDADTRHEEVQNRRRAYHQQVVADALAIAYESVEKKYDDSMKQLKQLHSDTTKAHTYDKKKAMEASITQEDNRELMNRLSLEFATLELEVVDELLRQPENYLIARSKEEIEKETDQLLEDADFKDVPNGGEVNG